MRSRMVSVLAGTVLAVGLGVSASVLPASAADGPDAWRTGFPPASAIPASLGNYGTAPEVSAGKSKGRWFVCDDLQARPAIGVATAEYATTPVSQSGIRDDSRVYSSPASAKAAFKAIAAGLEACVGSVVKVSEPGSRMKWVVTTSVGDVPSVTVDGSSSLFVYEKVRPAKGSSMKQGQLSSSYSVLTLAGDTILVSDASVAGVASLTKAQREAVASWAADFVTSWSEAKG